MKKPYAKIFIGPPGNHLALNDDLFNRAVLPALKRSPTP